MIHPQACVDDTAKLGACVTVWQFASVIRRAWIGDDCVVGSCAIVDGATVGNNCRIGHGAQLHPGTFVGNDCFIGPGAIICNDMWPQVSKAGFDLENRATVVLEDGAVIGAGAIILPGVTIRKRGMAAAGAVVESDIPEDMIWRRNGYMGKVPENATDMRMRFAVGLSVGS